MRNFVGADVIAAGVFGGRVTADTVLKYARFKIIPCIRVNRRGPVLFDPEAVRTALAERSAQIERNWYLGDHP
jgi:hypothetical protein